ncbi:MAG: penicillin-binding protein 2 [Candidatus Dormibacteraeota bacterium]|nr:penicillin-binding protein 2 [Candidatus Dormibacteraeota bacterium]
MTEERGRLRILWLMAAAGILATVLVARLAYWQVAQHDHIVALAAEQHSITVTLPASRGSLLDRNSQLLASDIPVYDVVAAPNLVPIADRVVIAGQLAPLVGRSTADLLKDLGRPLKFEYLKRKLPKEASDRIQALHLPGIALQQDSARSYLLADPGQGGQDARSLASNLLGFVNFSGQGQYGVEQYYDALLRGTDGVESTLKTGANQTITLSDRKRTEPRKGDDLVLGLDSQVQYFAEKALQEGVKKTHSESGTVLIMEPTTGNIVAWADYPTFDSNRYATTDPKLLTDPVVSGLYEPGSLMKVVTLSGSMDAGAITPDYSFNETGAVSVGGYTIHDWDLKPHGNVSMTRVLELSLNAGAVKAMQLEGSDSFYHYFQAFGIGRKTGIDVANEVNHPLPALHSIYPSEMATMAFGQGVAVTPIEMISALNTVATGGRVVRPRAVIQRRRSDGTVVDMPVDTGTPAVSPATAAKMRDMMISVTEKGSGKPARIDGWANRIAGKTGTANIPENGKYTDKVIASFAGFMPADHPRFTMVVIMRKPQGTNFEQEGTFAAAPVWKQIAQQILVQWQMSP